MGSPTLARLACAPTPAISSLTCSAWEDLSSPAYMSAQRREPEALSLDTLNPNVSARRRGLFT